LAEAEKEITEAEEERAESDELLAEPRMMLAGTTRALEDNPTLFADAGKLGISKDLVELNLLASFGHHHRNERPHPKQER
jgi:riboflavin biosynthesis pyrimidine reductase